MVLMFGLTSCHTYVASVPTENPFTPVTNTSIPTQTKTPTLKVTPTNTKSPTRTSTPTKTLRPTRTHTTTTTATPTFPPYPLKQVFIQYGNRGDHSYLGIDSVNLVLYTDGQIIISKPSSPIMTSELSDQQMCTLFLKLTKLGFYEIETNNKRDQTDPLYDFGSNYEKVYDGLANYILVNGEEPKSLTIYEPYWEFLIPEAKQLFRFIEEYDPGNMMPYHPDRILMWVEDKILAFAEPQKTLPWPEGLPTLKTSGPKIVYLDGTEAEDAFNQVFSKAYYGIFIEDSQEYTVIAEPVLPHQALGSQSENNSPVVIPFQCK